MNGNWEEIEDIKMLTGAARRKLKEFRDVDTTGDFEGHGSFLRHVVSKLKRLAILEAAVAWHGWDEVPDGSRGYFEIKYLDGSLGAGTLVIRDSDVFVKMLRHGNIKLENAHEFATGWRYPVGDLG